jgi:hypothetical protein
LSTKKHEKKENVEEIIAAYHRATEKCISKLINAIPSQIGIFYKEEGHFQYDNPEVNLLFYMQESDLTPENIKRVLNSRSGLTTEKRAPKHRW